MKNIMRAAGSARSVPGNRKRASVAAASAVFACLSILPATAQAQESSAGEAASSSLTLELNALQPSERGCRFTFVATNELGNEVSQVAFELALFDKAGMISRLTIVDFKELPQGKTKVRQFDFPSVDCADLGRVLVNDATQCVGENVEAQACIRNLKTKTGTDVVFGS